MFACLIIELYVIVFYLLCRFGCFGYPLYIQHVNNASAPLLGWPAYRYSIACTLSAQDRCKSGKERRLSTIHEKHCKQIHFGSGRVN